jgi:histidinol dehydrogenase
METIRIIRGGDDRALSALTMPVTAGDGAVARRVAAIVSDVRRRGDRAILGYARQFDGLRGALEVGRTEIEAAERAIPASVRRALRTAAAHIRRVARAQVPRASRVRVAPGVVIEQVVTPLGRVGCYVPAGRYPLPSSLLMTAIPARIAGVEDVIAVCPRPDAVVLAAAKIAGVDRVFRVGGAHAIAALAYGTRTIPRVDRIVGPGSTWVAEAKALVSRDCAIDFYAGPSEIVIVSDRAPAAWIAADMLAQAEHDVEARAIFITTRAPLARQVQAELARRVPPTGPARESLARRGAIVIARSRAEAVSLADRLTPEHLVCDDAATASQIRAGTAFVGAWSAQAAGDYATGSNHVLPTAGAARFRGGLSAADFVRVTSRQHISERGLRGLAPAIIALAEAEGLQAHADSIRERCR